MRYLPLLGSMLARVPLPCQSRQGQGQGLGPASDESKRYLRTAEILGDAITNAIREVHFFQQTAADAGFDLSVGPSRSSSTSSHSGNQGHTAPFHPIAPETDAYLNYMSRIAYSGTFLEQLTLLWSMEILYFRAWSQAASGPRPRPSTSDTSGKSDVNGTLSPRNEAVSSITPAQSEAISSLINNWSSAEFGTFVEVLGDLLDLYGGQGDITRLTDDELARVQAVWRHTIWLEKSFWEAGRGQF